MDDPFSNTSGGPLQPEAFDELLADCWQYARRTVTAVAAGEIAGQDLDHLVLDVAADCAMQVWFVKGGSVDNLNAYVNQAARNAVIAYGRRQQVQRKYFPAQADCPDDAGRAATAEPAVADVGGLHAVLRGEQAERVRRVLETLSPEDRQLLIERHVEGWTLDEMAAAHGIPRSTLVDRLLRVGERFRRAWRKMGGDAPCW